MRLYFLWWIIASINFYACESTKKTRQLNLHSVDSLYEGLIHADIKDYESLLDSALLMVENRQPAQHQMFFQSLKGLYLYGIEEENPSLPVINYFIQNNDLQSAAYQHHLLSKYFSEKSRFDSAYYYILKAIDQYQQVGDSAGILTCYSSRMHIARKLNLQIDLNEMYTSLSGLMEGNPQNGIDRFYEHLSDFYYYNSYGYDSSYKYINLVLQYLPINEYPRRLTNILLNKAIICNGFEWQDSARYFAKLAIKQKANSQNKDLDFCRYHNLMAQIEFDEGAEQQALQHLDSAIEIAIGLKEFHFLTGSLRLKQVMHRFLGQTTEEINTLETLLRYKDSTSNKQEVELIYNLNKKYDLEKKKRKIEEQKNELIIRKKRNQLLFISLIVFILLAVIAFLLLRQRMIEQRRAERQKLEEVLAESEIKAIAATLEGQSGERKRLSEELHDRIGSLLSAARMHISVLSKDQALTDLNHLISDSLKELRMVTQELANEELNAFQLPLAIEKFIEHLKIKEQLKVNLITTGVHIYLPVEQEIELLRLIQEVISNTIKHAQANELNIHLTYDTQGLSIMAEDDGVGFEVDAPKQGIGLNNIKKRAARIGADLTIDSQPNRGTTIIIELSNISL